MKNIKLGLVIPCFNEEEVITETANRLELLFDKMIEKKEISNNSFICFVDDGSYDKTWNIIEKISAQSRYFKGIKLSRNFGHQNALIAGLMQLKDSADVLISMDADLQDDLKLINKFVEKYKDGYDIVYGVRNNRSTDTKFKRNSAKLFYTLQNKIGANTIPNHADYRLMSRRSLDALSKFEEINLFLRGVVPLLGFKSCNIYYDRTERFAGETKYPLKKMILFALDGITSFSTVPLRIITFVGFIIFILSITGIIWSIIEKLILGNAVQGWASTMVSIYFIGGIQIMSLGIIGEYIGRIFQQVKNRPKYIIDKEI